MDNFDIIEQMADIKGIAKFDKGFQPFWWIVLVLVVLAIVLGFVFFKKKFSQGNIEKNNSLIKDEILSELEKIKTNSFKETEEKWTNLLIVFKKYLGFKNNFDFLPLSEKEILEKIKGQLEEIDFKKIEDFLKITEIIRFSGSKIYDNQAFAGFYSFMEDFIISGINNNGKILKIEDKD